MDILQASGICSVNWNLFKVNKKDIRTKATVTLLLTLTLTLHILMSLFLTLNMFYILLLCFYWWLWTDNCRPYVFLTIFDCWFLKNLEIIKRKLTCLEGCKLKSFSFQIKVPFPHPQYRAIRCGFCPYILPGCITSILQYFNSFNSVFFLSLFCKSYFLDVFRMWASVSFFLK